MIQLKISTTSGTSARTLEALISDWGLGLQRYELATSSLRAQGRGWNGIEFRLLLPRGGHPQRPHSPLLGSARALGKG